VGVQEAEAVAGSVGGGRVVNAGVGVGLGVLGHIYQYHDWLLVTPLLFRCEQNRGSSA